VDEAVTQYRVESVKLVLSFTKEVPMNGGMKMLFGIVQ
jgi:hypothetical protein